MHFECGYQKQDLIVFNASKALFDLCFLFTMINTLGIRVLKKKKLPMSPDLTTFVCCDSRPYIYVDIHITGTLL